MKMKRISPSDGKEDIYHKLGNLRIAGPDIEVDAFAEWLKTQNCYIWGYNEIPAISSLRAIDMVIDIYGPDIQSSPEGEPAKKPESNEGLKLFVWTGVLANWSDGVMFALAHTVEEAQEVLERDRKDWMSVGEIYEKSPEIVDSPKGFHFSGGE